MQCSADECEDPGDCSGGCACKASLHRVDPLNPDPNDIKFNCAALSFFAAVSAIGGRSLERVESGYCRCNSTYVSVGCCYSSDGLVWEEPDLNVREVWSRLA